MKKAQLIVTEGVLDSKDLLYKFHDLSRLKSQLTALISQVDEKNIIWHEQLGHSNFHSLKLMVIQNMVFGLPKVL